MSKREKTLALLVLIALLAWSGNYAFKSYSQWLTELDSEISALEKEDFEFKRDMDLATKDKTALISAAARSLPANPSAAQTAYKSWLLTLLQNDLKMQNVKITSDPIRTVSDIYDKHSFQISCEGSLQQLTEFLYRFYSNQTLHQISSLAVQPKGYNFLRVTARVEAIAVKTSDPRKTISEIESVAQLNYGGLDDYLALMTNRNLFGPENKEPNFSGSSQIAATVGRETTVTLAANPGANEQEVQSIRYELVNDEMIPPGFIANIRNNRLTVRGNSTGKFDVTIAASDTGLPSLTVKKKFTVTVSKQPPPPEPRVRTTPPVFDIAKLAYFTSTVQINQRVEVWILRRDTSKMLKLTIGDPISIGTIAGEITQISQKELIITTENNETLLVKAGDSLASAENLTLAAERLLNATGP